MLLAALNAYGKSIFTENILTRDHTEIMMEYLGFDIKQEIISNKKNITIQGGQDLPAKDIIVSGDPSSAAFMVAAVLLVKGSEITIKNVLINKYRIGFYEVLKKMGANIEFNKIRSVCNEQVADIKVKYSKCTRNRYRC